MSYSLVGKHLTPLFTELEVELERSPESIKKDMEAEKRMEKRLHVKPVRHPAFISNKHV